MLHKGQRIGSLRLVGTCMAETEGFGWRKVYVLLDMDDDAIYIGGEKKDEEISEEALIAIVNKHYPLQ